MWHATAGSSRPGTTSRGLRLPRRLAASLAALAATGLTVLPASSAFADDTDADLQLQVNQGNLQMQSGGQPTTLVFSVTNNGPNKASHFTANVNIPFGDKGVVLAQSNPACNQNGGPTVVSCPVNELESGQTTVFTLVINPPAANTLAATDSFNADGEIQVAYDGGGDPNGDNNDGQFSVVLAGAPPAVTSITGTVTDTTGQPISGANVLSRDVNGATCSATSNATGAFTCSPPSPGLSGGGPITVEATMAGYQLSKTSVTPTNGAVTSVALALAPAASASPSPSPAATSAPASASPQPQAIKKNGGSFPWDTVLVVGGILIALAALGGGAWWIYKRKDKDSDPNGPGDGPELVGAESLLPTMPMQVPSLSSNSSSEAQTAVWGAENAASSGAGVNAPTQAWGATPGWAPQGGGNWSHERVAQANRSTDPLPTSGGGSWSAGNGHEGERTAEWTTVDPQDDAGTSSSVNESTAPWPSPAFPAPASGAPALSSAPPYPGSVVPAQSSAQPYPGSGTPAQSSSPPPYSGSGTPAQSPAPPYSASVPPYSASAPPFPTSAAPYPSQPTSAAPYSSWPNSAPPYSSQPNSAAPYGQPISAAPYPGQPTSAGPFQVPRGPAGSHSAQPAAPDPYARPTSAAPFASPPPPAAPYDGRPTSAAPYASQQTSGAAYQPQYQGWQAQPYQPYNPPGAASSPYGAGPNDYAQRPADRYGQAEAQDPSPFSRGTSQPNPRSYADVPGEAPDSQGYYGGATPGAPLAGWDTPPAVVPPRPPSIGYNAAPGPIPPAPPGPPPAAPTGLDAWPDAPPPPRPVSGPAWSDAAPFRPEPRSAWPQSGPPNSDWPPPPNGQERQQPANDPGYGNYTPAAPEPGEQVPQQWWSDQPR